MQLETNENSKDYLSIFKETIGKDFNQYYKKYYPKLVWIVQKMNINQIDAEDIANRAFMRSLDKIEQYNKQYHYSTWLFDIGKKMAYQFKKDSAKIVLIDTTTKNEEDDNLDYAYYAQLQLETVDIEDNFEIANDLKYNETLKEISNLSPKFKNIIELCDIHGLSYLDIAEITGENLQTVKNRLHHGRKKLQEKLKTKIDYITEHY